MAEYDSVVIGDGRLATLVSEDGEREILAVHLLNPPRGRGGIAQSTGCCVPIIQSETSGPPPQTPNSPMLLVGSDGEHIYYRDPDGAVQALAAGPPHTNIAIEASGTGQVVGNPAPVASEELLEMATATLNNTSERAMIVDVYLREKRVTFTTADVDQADAVSGEYRMKWRYTVNAAISGALVDIATLAGHVPRNGLALGAGTILAGSIAVPAGEYIVVESYHYYYIPTATPAPELAVSAQFMGGGLALTLRGFTQ